MQPKFDREPVWLTMGYESDSMTEELSERQLLDRVRKLEEQLKSQESLKQQICQLENHVSKLLLQETNSGSFITSSVPSIPTVSISSSDETHIISVLPEKEMHHLKEENSTRVALLTPKSDKKSEIPEHDNEEIQEVKSVPNTQIYTCKSPDIRNPKISSDYKIDIVKLPNKFQNMKVALQQEKKKNDFLEQELVNCKSECNVMKKKLKHMRDEQNELKKCHMALLDKAVSTSSFHKKNLQKLVAYIRKECVEIQEKLTIQQFIESGDATMIQLLIDAGDDANAADHAGFTLLHDVAGGGYVEMAEILLNGGADINARATGGITPLHQAAIYGHLEMCQLLISKGCPVDQRSDFKSTPLHYAAENGHLEVVQFLVKCGANVNTEDSGGVTPFEDATRAGHIAVAMWLAQNFSDEEQSISTCSCDQQFN